MAADAVLAVRQSSTLPNLLAVNLLGNPLGNVLNGINIGTTAAAPDGNPKFNQISNNVISGNVSVGIQIFNDATVFNGSPVYYPPGTGANNLVLGNLIGVNAINSRLRNGGRPSVCGSWKRMRAIRAAEARNERAFSTNTVSLPRNAPTITPS